MHEAPTVDGGLVPLQMEAKHRVILQQAIRKKLHFLLLHQIMAHVNVHESLVNEERFSPLFSGPQVQGYLVRGQLLIYTILERSHHFLLLHQRN